MYHPLKCRPTSPAGVPVIQLSSDAPWKAADDGTSVPGLATHVEMDFWALGYYLLGFYRVGGQPLGGEQGRISPSLSCSVIQEDESK